MPDNGLVKICAALILSLLVLPALDAEAQTATDLNCAGCVDTKDLADGSVRNRTIAKGAVSADKLSAPSGAAGTKPKSKQDATGTRIAQKIKINVPNKGIVVVNASMSITFKSTNGSVACGLSKEVTLSGPLLGVSGSNASNADNRKSFAVTRTFAVRKRGKRSFYLICSTAPGTVVDLVNATMTATYAPTNILAK